MVSNPNFYGQSTTGTPNQIEDGVDFPHTGIIKALADGLGQNYGISGFDITTDSATQIDVGAGVIIRDGKREAIDAVPNLTLGLTSSGNNYHLVVVDKDDNIVIRSPSAADKVAEYTVRASSEAQGDTIIAVVTHNGNDPMPIQYLTVDKAENSLSVARSASGTYTEEGTITALAGGGIKIATTQSDENIEITPNGNGKIILDGQNWPISDGTANQFLKTDGSNQLSYATISEDQTVSLTGAGITAVTGTYPNFTITSNETDTLDSVVAKGASTVRAVTVGGLTADDTSITNTLTLSKTLTLDADNTVIVNLADASTNAPANQFNLPSASINTGKVYFIKNMNAVNDMNVVTAEVFDNNQQVDDPRYVSATQLTLKPLESVLLQAFASASLPSPVNTVIDDSWLILDVNSVRGNMNGSLDVNGNSIVSTSNGDITIAPHGTGKVILDGLNWPTSDGSADQLLKTNGSGQLAFTTAYSDNDAISAVEGEATLALSGSVTVADGKTFKTPRLLTVDITVDDTLTETEHAGRYCFVTGGSRTITLGAGAADIEDGIHYTLISNDANGFTLTSTKTMNGSLSDITVDARNAVTIIADGSNYVVLGA